MGEQFDLVVTGGTVLAMTPGAQPIAAGAVAIRDGAIAAVGPATEMAAAGHARRVLDAEGGLILPGFVNTHTHLAMTLLRGLADDLPLQVWLQEHVWPAEAHLTAQTVGLGTRWAAVESLKAGVTTACDGYFFGDAVAEAAGAVGLRTIVTEGLLDFPTPACPTPVDAIARQRELLQRYAGHRLIVPSVAAHAVYTVSPEWLTREADLAAEFSAPLQIHVAETAWEVDEVRRRTGLSPVAYLDTLDVLSSRLVAAHCVHVDENDIDLLASRGVAVATAPVANLKLGSGVAPILAMLARGLRIGIGTDGAASNNTLDLLRDAQLMALLHKGLARDPTVLPARQLVEMLTTGGATALGLDGRVGTLQPGKRADLIVMSLTEAHAMPLSDPFAHLAYAARASDVRHVVVDGQLVVEARRVMTVDERELRAEIGAAVRTVR
jgi:5-methylthioadenosine/S-adenosylhomocysteine deaminase